MNNNGIGKSLHALLKGSQVGLGRHLVVIEPTDGGFVEMQAGSISGDAV